MSGPAFPKSLAVAILALGAALALRLRIIDPQAERRSAQRSDEDFLSSPGPDILRIATFEHRLAWADVMWLGIVQELAKPFEGTEGSWDRVQRWSNIAVDLDPRYLTVYHTVAIHLSVYAKRVEPSNHLLLKGRAALPEAWEIPFVLGYNAYFLASDADAGADWMAIAAKLPGSPRHLAPLAGRMKFQAGNEQEAIEMLEMMLESTPEGPTRDAIQERLLLLRSEARLRLFDDGCRLYHAKHGRVPADGETLVREGLVRAPPFDLLGGPIERFDDDCLAHTPNTNVREETAKKRIGSELHTRTSTAEPLY